jgi:4-amino-4-deoxy-L-arabinose transferase-like glycosyltransferase
MGLWAFVLVGLGYSLIKNQGQISSFLQRLKKPISGFPPFLASGVLFTVLIIGVTAFQAAPNAADVLSYHFPRVAHWIQNQTLSPYPTIDHRQIHMPPFAEYIFLHLKILSGTDRLPKLVQWAFMIGSALNVSLIAKVMGANRRQQFYAALVALSIPEVLLQAASAKNDIVLAFWITALTYLSLKVLYWEKKYWDFLKIGIALGFALLTKGTGYIYGFFVMAWLVLALLRGYKIKVWKPVSVILLAAIVINNPYFYRNLQVYNSPLGDKSKKYQNEVYSLKMAISNITRNIALHLGTPIPTINQEIEGGIRALHEGMGIKVNDERTSFWGDDRFNVKLSNSPQTAGNLLHTLLIVGGIMVFFARGQLRRKRLLRNYAGMLIITFLFFCLFLKWQPYHTRLQIPLFILWSPWLVMIFKNIFSSRLVYGASLFIWLGSIPWVLYNYSHPLLISLDKEKYKKHNKVDLQFKNIWNMPRKAQYYYRNESWKKPYQYLEQVVDSTGCCKIGLFHASKPYLIWKTLERQEGAQKRAYTLRYIKVNNQISAKGLSFPEFDPCLLVVKREMYDQADTSSMRFNQNVYYRMKTFESLAIYQKNKPAS